MNLEKYPVCVDKDFIEYKFISEGPKGRVEKFPGAIIYAGGTTLSRTRLYRMGINKYLELLKIDFQIFGYYR